MNAAGAVSGMIVGILTTTAYIVWFKFIDPASNTPDHWFAGISPEGFGTIGMLLNFAVAIPVSLATRPPSAEIQAMIEDIRVPIGADDGDGASA